MRWKCWDFPPKASIRQCYRMPSFRKVIPAQNLRRMRSRQMKLLKGTHDCRLVRIEATIIDRGAAGTSFLSCRRPMVSYFTPILENPKEMKPIFPIWKTALRVAVTGVCLIETGAWSAEASPGGQKSFRLMMRSANDISVLQWPPWWNLQKLLWAVSVLGVIVLGTFAWVVVSGPARPATDAHYPREAPSVEAALKARYENLFENANDMVFTCTTSSGRITSVNQAGEQLLRYSREENR